MDPHKFSLISHGSHQFQSPVTPAILDRALAFAGLKPGDRVFDLGCGHGAIALHLAESYGVHVEAVERSPAMAQRARERAAGRGAPGSVAVHQAGSTEFLETAGTCDLVFANGAIHLAGDLEPVEMLKALAEHVRPGGTLYWGETTWLHEPSPDQRELFRQLLGPTASAFRTYAQSVAAGEQAGLLPLYAATCSRQDFDEYAWRCASAVEDYVRDHPDDPDGPALRARAQGWRALYLHQMREHMTFGMYLFRKP